MGNISEQIAKAEKRAGTEQRHFVVIRGNIWYDFSIVENNETEI